MEIDFTQHAKERMSERSISMRTVLDALRDPTKVLYDTNNRLLIKKFYKRRNKVRLLLIVVEIEVKTFKIITMIDTSKVKKYI